MDLRQLSVFVRVAEAGSFSRAAQELFIAQSALSQHIARLEADLGVKLLSRHSRGVTLTEEGETLFRHAVGILRGLQQAREAVRHHDAPPTGEVAMGLPVTLSPLLALPLMAAVAERLPRVRLRLVESNTGFLLEWVRAGRLDLAVLFDDPGVPELEHLAVLAEELYLLSPPRQAPRGDDTVAFRQLAGLPLLLPGRPHRLRSTIEAVAAGQGVALTVRFELESLTIIKQAVRAGLGHTIASWASAQEEVLEGRLTRLRIIDPPIRRTVVLTTVLTRPLSRGSLAVRDLLAELMRELVESGRWRAELLD